MKKQRCFSQMNVSLLYVSPYIEFYPICENKILLYRRDTDYKIMIECSTQDILDQFLNILQIGTTKHELLSILNVTNDNTIEHLVEMCIRKGVIE